MDWLWTWGGRCFGYRGGDNLWTYDGRHVGRLVKDEVYSPDGHYLGEINNGRLITRTDKKGGRGPRFSARGRRGAFAKMADYAGYAMLAGYEDFPQIEK